MQLCFLIQDIKSMVHEKSTRGTFLAAAAAVAFLDAGFLVPALDEGLADAFDAGLAFVVADLGLAFAAAVFALGLSAEACCS